MLSIKTILYTACISLILLLGMVFFAPLPFTACSPDSLWRTLAFGFTNSGGPSGFIVLLLITGFCYTLSAKTLKEKTMVFLKSILALVVFFGALALINERYTKPVLKLQRPSHIYMLNKTGLTNAIDSLYKLDKKDRQAFFNTLTNTHRKEFSQIDPAILDHWVEEAGFSFPSGHTFNAFLFAMILAYAIIFNRTFPHLRKLFFIPFVWAFFVGISRVSMGVHTAVDVSAGAILGVAVGLLFLYIDITRHWLTRKTKQ